MPSTEEVRVYQMQLNHDELMFQIICMNMGLVSLNVVPFDVEKMMQASCQLSAYYKRLGPDRVKMLAARMNKMHQAMQDSGECPDHAGS